MVARLMLGLVLSSFFVFCSASPPEAWAQKGRIKVVTQSPLSGEQAALGEHIKLGAQLAVEDASKRLKALGYDLILVPMDDQAKPEVGVANARNVAADPDVLLVVGHFNSGVARPASDERNGPAKLPITSD